MGQMARMARAERFIEHFEKLLLPHAGVKPGDTLTVVSVGLAQRECSGEEVVFEAVLHRVDGSPLTAELPFGVLFDPEYDSTSDVVERLTDLFEIDPKETTRLLDVADLL